MKKLIAKAVVAASIVLAGCGSLPDKSKVEAGTGVLAIAKAYQSGVSHDAGWAPEVSIRKFGAKEAEMTVRLPAVSGKQFQIVKNLSPDTYVIDQIRYVALDKTSAIGNTTPWENINIVFTIYADKVSVLDKVLIAKTQTVGGSGNHFTTNWAFFDWNSEAKASYSRLMNKYNKKGNWEVVDKKGQPFIN